MKLMLSLLASASVALAQWQGGHGGRSWNHSSFNGSDVGNGNAGYPHHRWGWHMPGDSPPASGVQNATFEQLLDHSNPAAGTFSQFYFWDTQ